MNTKQISDDIMVRLVKAKHHKNIPYNRFKGSSLDDIRVMDGLLVEWSVDPALRGKHYRHGVRCILLWREALIQKRLSQILKY